MGIFSLIGGIIGGGAAAKASKKAAQLQFDATKLGIDESGRQFDQTRTDFAPYQALGSAAAPHLANLLGIGGSSYDAASAGPNWGAYLSQNPDVAAGYNGVDHSKFATPTDYAKWHYANYGQTEGRSPGTSAPTGPNVSAADAQASEIAALKGGPLYQQLYNTGVDTLLQTASATGGLRGGNTQHSLPNFAADTLNSVIAQQLANYSGAVGIGSGASGAVGNFGANAVAQQNQLRNQGAGAQAQSALYRSGIAAQNWQNAGSGLDLGLGSLFGGGGSGGGGSGGAAAGAGHSIFSKLF